MTTQTIPVSVILLAPTLRMIDRSLDDAALVAGAGSLAVLRRIVLPLAVPGLLVAGTAGFIKALEAFEIEELLGPRAGISIYANEIYDFVRESPPAFAQAMALSLVFVLPLLVLALFHRRIQNRVGPVDTMVETGGRSKAAYSPQARFVGTVFLGGFVFFVVLVPFIMLLAGSFMKIFGFLSLPQPWTTGHWRDVVTSVNFLDSARATIALGVSAALPGTLIFAMLAWGVAQMRPSRQVAASVLIWLPWALPGLVLGITLLELMLGVPGFRLLHGTAAPLIFALILKELPIGVHMMRASIAQTSGELIDAAAVAGAGRASVFRRILMPLNVPALVVAFLLIFAATVRDISTIILIAPPDVQTLSLMMFGYTLLSEFESASVVGIVVSLLAVTVSALAYRLAGRSGILT